MHTPGYHTHIWLPQTVHSVCPSCRNFSRKSFFSGYKLDPPDCRWVLRRDSILLAPGSEHHLGVGRQWGQGQGRSLSPPHTPTEPKHPTFNKASLTVRHAHWYLRQSSLSVIRKILASACYSYPHADVIDISRKAQG